MALALQKFIHEEEEIDNDTPLRYVPIRHLYSSTAPCISASGSSNVMSKKVKARKLVEPFESDLEKPLEKLPPPPIRVYRRYSVKKPSVFDSLLKRVESESKNPRKSDGIERGKRDNSNQSDGVLDSESEGVDRSLAVLDSVKVRKIIKKQKKTMNYELLSLGIDSSYFHEIHESGSRERRDCNQRNSAGKAKCDSLKDHQKLELQKRWVELGFEDVDPHTFIGLSCKVFWPKDDEWYPGSVTGYDSETKQHHIKYNDGDDESVFLSCEKIKFYISREEMQRLNLKCTVTNIRMKGLDYDELLVLAADLDDCREIEPGDIIWAKLTGHAMWPALVMDESHVAACRGLNPKKRGPKPNLGERSVPVQFFGTHDFARINRKQVISFLKGLFAHFHLKCKQTRFHRSLEEAKMYLSEEKLPSRMLRVQSGDGADECDSASEKESVDSGDCNAGDERMQRSVECIKTCPFKIGDLHVISLGKIVRDSECFQDEQNIWPEGYTAIRKFFSIKDPTICTFYKMEVLRDPESTAQPIFRITSDDGAKIKGSTPSVCWKKVYRRIKKTRDSLSNGFCAEVGGRMIYKSGSHMFGFSNPKISKLIRGMCSNSKDFACKFASESYDDLPAGYRPVRVDWKDLDKCSVCHMDEEYENNLFLQCDKCRMMVHARCYGELEPLDGVLWLCNLCRPGAPISLPPCCLCPVIGGAMKPTTDGRWAHLTCAMWVPETFLLDVKSMEPIDGLNRINKDRWKLLCSICGVSYGACIQCSNSTCRVAYHPLCARAAGLCVELEDEDRLHLISVDEDDDQCIRLLSFCKKHRQPSNDRPLAGEKIGQTARHCSSYIPPSNPSGCARCEPYDFFGRRGLKEPEVLAAASVKRLFVENKPYLVSGYRQNGFLGDARSCNEVLLSSLSSSLQKSRTSQIETPSNILSMAEKYKYMRETFRKRLAFGKSRIHGFGIFAKLQHKAGDMVIEYTGELVRRPIADKREHFIYNSLVGAGTYMFRIDDERVIDATRAGSIAHLINHSCEPNCYSRVISVQGDEHIIIFAKRDINQWEELTYDYRFFSIDEQLACYCGFPRCRGVVNDIEAEEQVAKIRVPRRELINWTGE